MSGGYDDGYYACDCFWGKEPGSLLRELQSRVGTFRGMRILDVGCGEGKNAVFCAAQGARVVAMDVSTRAIRNAQLTWGTPSGIDWFVDDIRNYMPQLGIFDVVVGYGLLHCLSSKREILSIISRLQDLTRNGGYHVLCAFNDRHQDLSGHPGFKPTLLSHENYVLAYETWDLLSVSDKDLHESHPHNKIPHSHSITRVIARKS